MSLQHCVFVFLISLLHHQCLLDGFAAANLFAKLILIIVLIFCHKNYQQQHPLVLLRLPALLESTAFILYFTPWSMQWFPTNWKRCCLAPHKNATAVVFSCCTLPIYYLSLTALLLPRAHHPPRQHLSIVPPRICPICPRAGNLFKHILSNLSFSFHQETNCEQNFFENIALEARCSIRGKESCHFLQAAGSQIIEKDNCQGSR